ncbi:unnamed protein product, partial [Discosporangium mesarthrocarpum]
MSLPLPSLKDVLRSIGLPATPGGLQQQARHGGHGGDESSWEEVAGESSEAWDKVHGGPQHPQGPEGGQDKMKEGHGGRRRRGDFDVAPTDDWDSGPGTPHSTTSYMALSEGSERAFSVSSAAGGGQGSWDGMSDGGWRGSPDDLKGMRIAMGQVNIRHSGLYDTSKRPRIEPSPPPGEGPVMGYPPRPPMLGHASREHSTSHSTDEWRAVEKVGPKLGFDSLEEIQLVDNKRESMMKAVRVLGINDIDALQHEASRRTWPTNSHGHRFSMDKAAKMLGVNDITVLERESAGNRRPKVDRLRSLMKAAELANHTGPSDGVSDSVSKFNSNTGSLASANTIATEALSSVDNHSDRFPVTSAPQHGGIHGSNGSTSSSTGAGASSGGGSSNAAAPGGDMDGVGGAANAGGSRSFHTPSHPHSHPQHQHQH